MREKDAVLDERAALVRERDALTREVEVLAMQGVAGEKERVAVEKEVARKVQVAETRIASLKEEKTALAGKLAAMRTAQLASLELSKHNVENLSKDNQGKVRQINLVVAEC